MLDRLSRASRAAPSARLAAAARLAGIAAGPALPPAAYGARAGAGGAAWPERRWPRQRRGRHGRRHPEAMQVHQVLATLGYGDAIGHEVLGIQRVLREAGYESEIFVETADPRLEHLTRDYRDLVDVQLARQHPDPPLLDRLAGVAHRLRAARPDGARLPQHHAARVLRRRAPAAGAPVLPRPPRALGLRRALRPGARRLRVQPAGARGDGLPAHRRCCRSCPASRTSTCRPTGASPTQFDDEWTNVCSSAGSSRTSGSTTSSATSHAYQRLFNPRSRLLLVGSYTGFDRYHGDAAASWWRGSAPPDVHFLGHVSNARTDGVLRRRRRLPVRERARGLLRPAGRGVLQGHPGRSPTRRPPCRRRWTAPACCTDSRDPAHVAALIDAGRVRPPRCASAIVEGQDAALDAAAREGLPAARSCGSSTRVLAPGEARPAAGGRRLLGPGGRRLGAQFEELAAELRRPSGSDWARCPKAPARGSVSMAHDRQPVGAGGPPRRRHRRQRAAGARRCCARMGHESELYALTIDEDLRDEVRPFADPDARRRRRHDLPLRAAVADDRGRSRRCRAGACCSTTTSRRRTSSPRTTRACSAWRGSGGSELATLVGRVDLALGDSEYNRARARGAGLRADRRDADRDRHGPHHRRRRRRPALERDPGRRADELPVRRAHRAEQEDRGSHPAGRALQAVRQRRLPLHLRRPLRRASRATMRPSAR